MLIGQFYSLFAWFYGFLYFTDGEKDAQDKVATSAKDEEKSTEMNDKEHEGAVLDLTCLDSTWLDWTRHDSTRLSSIWIFTNFSQWEAKF